MNVLALGRVPVNLHLVLPAEPSGILSGIFNNNDTQHGLEPG